jgi:hypothetical protein
MLPFLMPKKTVSVIQQKKMSEGGEMKEEMSEPKEELVYAAEDVLSAIAMKDAKALAMALKSAFEILDASPHVEGEHLEEAE